MQLNDDFLQDGRCAAVGRAYAKTDVQESRRRAVFRPHKGPDGKGAGGVPQKRRQDNDKMLRGTSVRLHALYRTRGDHSEVARGDKPPIPQRCYGVLIDRPVF